MNKMKIKREEDKNSTENKIMLRISKTQSERGETLKRGLV